MPVTAPPTGPELSVLIPVYNEVGNVETLHAELDRVRLADHRRLDVDLRDPLGGFTDRVARMSRGCAHVGADTSAALARGSTSSPIAASRPFFRVASISPGVPPNAARFKRWVAVASFHFAVGNGVSIFMKPVS